MYWDHMPHFPSGAWGQALHHPTLDTALLVEVWNSHVRAKLSMQLFFSGTTFLLLHQLVFWLFERYAGKKLVCFHAIWGPCWYDFIKTHNTRSICFHVQFSAKACCVCSVCNMWMGTMMWLNWAVDTIAFASTQLANTLRVPGAGFGGRDEAPASKVMSTLQSDVCSWWSEQLPLPKLICLKLLSKGTQTGNLRQNYLALAGIFDHFWLVTETSNLSFYWLQLLQLLVVKRPHWRPNM